METAAKSLKQKISKLVPKITYVANKVYKLIELSKHC